MAGKKSGVELQTLVTTDEEWEEILKRPDLVVVDVYSAWSGPCMAMVSTLRKIKMEVGGEILSYAIAENDKIETLERFRGRSEPVWMFIQNAEMVNLAFGADAPKLKKILLEELKRIKQEEPPKWSIPITQRSPEEEERWKRKEAIRKAVEDQKRAIEEAERRAKYEAYMEHMVFELCEETALLLYPWVFLSQQGNPIDKNTSTPYVELVRECFPECFDIAEEVRTELDKETIERMFAESGVIVNDDLVQGLTEGKCMVMRLRGRPPHPDWPVPYPNLCLFNTERCPTRKINDIEDYLAKIIYEEPPPLLAAGVRMQFNEPYIKRHSHVHEPHSENGEDHKRVDPAVWIPPQARSKVHVFKTIFTKYLEKAHPYEEPVAPLPLCGFKYTCAKIQALQESLNLFKDYIEYFGAFEFDTPRIAKRLASNLDDFLNKVKYKTGNEIFVVILRRVNYEAFLAFAGIEPYYVNENNDEVLEMINDYFSGGVMDVAFIQELNEKESGEEEEEEEEEVEEEEFEEEEEGRPSDFGYGTIDYTLF